jgi:hypothetical protein
MCGLLVVIDTRSFDPLVPITLGGWVLFVLPTLLSSWLLGAVCDFVFERWRFTSGWAYAIAGMLCGLIAGLVWFEIIGALRGGWHGYLFCCGDLPPNSPPSSTEDNQLGAAIAAIVIGALTGTATARVYWIMVRPDRDAAANPVSAAP